MSDGQSMDPVDEIKRRSNRRIQRLTDMLIDKRLSPNSLRELCNSLKNNDEARRAYFEAILLQAELYYLGRRFRQEQ
jgi:hypothetical protein